MYLRRVEENENLQVSSWFADDYSEENTEIRDKGHICIRRGMGIWFLGSWSLLIHNYNPANIDRAVGHSPAVGEFISSKEEEFLKELSRLTSDWSIREDSREKN